MKKTVLFTVLLSSVLLQSCVFGDWDNGVSGDGNVIAETIDVVGFSGIHASSGIDVNISQGDFSVEVVADENLHEYITVEKEGQILRIDSERSIYRAKSKVVNVSLPELTSISISSAGDVKGVTGFTCDDLEIRISSAGDMDLEVDASDIDLSISSSGDCHLRGSANSLDAKLSSAGDLNAFDLLAEYVNVSVSSAGDARVWANKEIEMSASSAGNIYYKGDAEVIRSHTSSAGSIIKR
jgi:hypothetical protein